MRRMLLTMTALLLTPLSAAAGDLSPGLWEISMETRVPASPDFAPPPFHRTQCLRSEDARDPTSLLGDISTAGATGCSYSDKTYSGNTFSFTMQCSGTYGLQSRGQVSYSAETVEGRITSTANLGGGAAVQTENTLSARRIGGC